MRFVLSFTVALILSLISNRLGVPDVSFVLGALSGALVSLILSI